MDPLVIRRLVAQMDPQLNRRLETRGNTYRLGLVLAVAAFTLLALGPVRADEALPSGRILIGTGETAASPEVGYGCAGAPDCRYWLENGCRSDHAGKDPALNASIVEVGHLAGRSTPRTIASSSIVKAQFWTADCTEIPRTRWTSWDCRPDRGRCYFRIPAAALWMTVSTRADEVDTRWALD